MSGERGAASLLVVAMAGVLLLLGAALGLVGSVIVDHRRAQAAADLAALAGATELARGGDACAAAAAIASANGADLADCTFAGREVTVHVAIDTARWRGLRGEVEGAARAGP